MLSPLKCTLVKLHCTIHYPTHLNDVFDGFGPLAEHQRGFGFRFVERRRRAANNDCRSGVTTCKVRRRLLGDKKMERRGSGGWKKTNGIKVQMAQGQRDRRYRDEENRGE